MAYVALRTTDPNTKRMLAYGRLIIQVAQHTGLGWLEYDRIFRQQAAIGPDLEWNKLHKDIQGSTVFLQSSGRSSMCPHSFGYDHKPEQCALLYFQPPSLPTNVPSSLRPFPCRVQTTKRPEMLLGFVPHGIKSDAPFQTLAFFVMCYFPEQAHGLRVSQIFQRGRHIRKPNPCPLRHGSHPPPITETRNI